MNVLPTPTSTYQLLRVAAHAWPEAATAAFIHTISTEL
jgi:hypothetical protein